MVENSMVIPTGVNTNRNRQRRVVFYGRVSSEHEAQLSALENQIQWYDDIATRHQNWMVLRKYVDEGITETQAKKRPAFLQMIQDAKQKKFDLIIGEYAFIVFMPQNESERVAVLRGCTAIGSV